MSETTFKPCGAKLHNIADPANQIIRSDGSRICKACNRARDNRWRKTRYAFCKFNQARRLAGLAELTYKEFTHEQSTRRFETNSTDLSPYGGDIPGLRERAVGTDPPSSHAQIPEVRHAA